MTEAHPGLEEIEIGDEGRYERLELLPWWDTERMARARLLVVGVGAIGNEVLKNLALLGAGTVFAVDNDTVETTNLARCVLFREGDEGRPKVEAARERLAELNPDTRLVPLDGLLQAKVGVGLVRSCDAVIGCLDNVQARLHLDRLCRRAGVDLLDGAIDALGYQVSAFAHSQGGPGYEDTLPEGATGAAASCRDIQVRASARGHIATTPVSASVCGALLVQEALKRVHEGDPVWRRTDTGELGARDELLEGGADEEGLVEVRRPAPLRGAVVYGQGLTNQYGVEGLPTVPVEDPRALAPLAELAGDWSGTTLGELLARAREDVGSDHAMLDIAYEVKLEAECPDCGQKFAIFGPAWHVGDFAHQCAGAGDEGADPNWGLAVVEGGHVGTDTPHLDKTPRDWGLPPWHEYRALAPDSDREARYAFADDRSLVDPEVGP